MIEQWDYLVFKTEPELQKYFKDKGFYETEDEGMGGYVMASNEYRVHLAGPGKVLINNTILTGWWLRSYRNHPLPIHLIGPLEYVMKTYNSAYISKIGHAYKKIGISNAQPKEPSV